MNDDDHCEMLWNLLDGTLTAAEESMFRDHLGRCPTCMAELTEHEAITEALRAPGDEEPPAVIRTALRAEFRRLHEPSSQPREAAGFRLRWAFPVPAWGAAALLAFGVLAGVWLAPQRGPSQALPDVPAREMALSPVVLNYSIYQPDGSVRTVSRLVSPKGVQGDDARERDMR
jgi:anti-sigma factor RsiW